MPRSAAINIQDKLFTVAEVAALLRLDRHVVTGMFVGESGVLVLGNAETVRGCRKYRQLRIPQSVLNRVVARNTVR